MSMKQLTILTKAKSRSISAENFSGEKGRGGMALEGTGKKCARDLGQGWKVSPSVNIAPGEVFTMADIEGPGAITHIWMTIAGNKRLSILRIYWDEQEHPSVEVPIGDFFAAAYPGYAQVNSLAVCVNPYSGFNSYWEMPFKKRCRITMENLDPNPMVLYYQLDYELREVAAPCAYFHASFRRVNPLPCGEVHTILDGVEGWGSYAGTYIAWGVHSNGWWGEGEIKFYMDGDKDWPTICGTGTEDYFCGSYDFDVEGHYVPFSSPYTGMPQVIIPDGLYKSQQRFGMYRWHITDPVRFEKDLKVTIQALGWFSDDKADERRYLPLRDDIASVAYWYQTLPSNPLRALPGRDDLTIN